MPPVPDRAPPGPADPSPGRSVLLVEDDEGVRHFVRTVLEQAGYAVHTAADGDQALALFRAATASVAFDLVLSDVLMPNRTGPELVAELRTLCPRVRFLLMSGFTGGDARHPAALPEGVELIEKPFTIDRLLQAVARALGSNDE